MNFYDEVSSIWNIRYKEVIIGNITIGSTGYTGISEYYPSSTIPSNHFLFALVWLQQSYARALTIVQGSYIVGEPNFNATNVYVRYFYYK